MIPICVDAATASHTFIVRDKKMEKHVSTQLLWEKGSPSAPPVEKARHAKKRAAGMARGIFLGGTTAIL